MAFFHYDGGVVADQATGRPLMGQPIQVFDEETDAPVQAYREGQPVTLVTGVHGLIQQFQTEDTTRRVRLHAGPVRLRQWCQEMIASAADASGSISSALEQVEVARSEAAAIVPRMEQIETMAGLAPGEVTDAQTANLITQPATATRNALNAATARWLSEVNVRDYGATGDGTTDDTAAFQAAFQAARTVRVPDGDYVVNTVAVDGGTVMLTRDARLIHKSASTNHMFIVAEGGRFQVQGGTVDGNHRNQTGRRYIIRASVPDSTTVRVLATSFTGTKAAAVYGYNFGGQMDVIACRFEDMAEHDGTAGNWTCAVYVESGQPGARGNLRFDNNTVRGTTAPTVPGGAPGGVFFAPTLNYADKTGNQSTFQAKGNHFWGIGQHASVNDISPLHTYPHVRGARFTGNYFEASAFCAISAKSVEDFVCTGNTVVDGQISPMNTATEGAISYAPGYHALTARPRAVISNNIIANPGGESATVLQTGISVLGTGESVAQDITISGNVISGVGGAGIKVDRARDLILTGNVVKGGTAGVAGSDYGMRFDNITGDVLLSNNRITAPNGHGLYCLNGSATARFILEGNIIDHTAAATYALILRGVALVKLSANLIRSTTNAVSIAAAGSARIGHLAWDASNTIESGVVGITWADIDKATGSLSGTGSPEGVVASPVGTTFVQTNGVGGATHWVKEVGTGKSGWATANFATSSTQLVTASSPTNTAGKYAGRQVFNTSQNRPVYATGSAPTAPWVYADGTTAHTPV